MYFGYCGKRLKNIIVMFNEKYGGNIDGYD